MVGLAPLSIVASLAAEVSPLAGGLRRKASDDGWIVFSPAAPFVLVVVVSSTPVS